MKNRAEFYQDVVYPMLSHFDAEDTHRATISILGELQKTPPGLNLLHELACVEGERFCSPLLETRVGGITFENPLILAAGFDKNGRAVRALYEIGFSSVEVGTVTLNPQDGNPRPRVFRIEPESLLNHLGFPNDGVAKISTNIASYEQLGFPLGVSLGINKDTPHTQAAEDLAILAHILAPVADYLVINFSSPNTPQLRDVLYSQLLSEILSGVRVQSMNKPIWLKVPPDLTLEQLDQLIRFVVDHRVQGVIATNTTIDYTVLPHDTVFEPVKGGLSGQVLRSKSTAVLEHLYKESGGKIDLIGSGGVTSLESLLEKFSVGAKAVSLYTGLVYTGPTLPSQLNRDLVEWLTQHKVSLAELVGQKL